MDDGVFIGKFFSVLLLLCMLQQGWAASCRLSNIEISQRKTGLEIGGKPEFEVEIRNTCECPQANVIVSCDKLGSVEPVDPSIIKPVDDQNCVVNDGFPIDMSSPIQFKYARYHDHDIGLVSADIYC